MEHLIISIPKDKKEALMELEFTNQLIHSYDERLKFTINDGFLLLGIASLLIGLGFLVANYA